MNLPSSDQVNAGLRHAGTAAASAVTVFAVLGIIPQDKVAEVIADLHQFTDGLTQAFGGLSKLVVVLGPIAVAWFGKMAMTASSLTGQLKSVSTNPNAHIDGKIIVPTDVANAVPSDKVVAK